MKRPKRYRQRNLLRVAAASALWRSAGVLAADEGGCYHSADGVYQIGQTVQIVVTNDTPEGTLLRDESATGDGNVLATCMKGPARFEGFYANAVNGIVPLTVGGKASGVGVELFIVENEDGIKREFPHNYTRTFNAVTPVRSNEAYVGYRIRRMAGPVEFGALDRVAVGRQRSFRPDGTPTAPFRHMQIYDLRLVRPACSIVAEDLNQTVTLGPYNASNFATPDRATPWEVFRLRVQECQDPIGLVARFTFGTPADAVAGQPDLFTLNGPENVGLELGDESKDNIAPGTVQQINALGSGDSYTFHARLRETRPTVRGGSFSRPVNVVVEFR